LGRGKNRVGNLAEWNSHSRGSGGFVRMARSWCD
jgi:hypothetical protein